jgi:hypothetical protein
MADECSPVLASINSTVSDDNSFILYLKFILWSTFDKRVFRNKIIQNGGDIADGTTNDFYVFLYISGCFEPILVSGLILEITNKMVSKFTCSNLPFFKMSEISKMAADFYLTIKWSYKCFLEFVCNCLPWKNI